jgi:hypothetical protein
MSTAETEAKLPETLTVEDGEAIKIALLAALRRSPDPELRKLAQEIAGGSPRIDSGGELYIGTWRLDRSKMRLVKRTPGMTEGPIFDADVLKQAGHWIVGDVTVGRMTRPR